jgi:hypothetical protein
MEIQDRIIFFVKDAGTDKSSQRCSTHFLSDLSSTTLVNDEIRGGAMQSQKAFVNDFFRTRCFWRDATSMANGVLWNGVCQTRCEFVWRVAHLVRKNPRTPKKRSGMAMAL